MEPMTLGSPVGSPIQTPGSPGASSYLPGFLLGDTTTPSKIGLTSPETPRHLNTTGSNLMSPLNHYGTPDYRINRQKAVFGNATTTNTSQIGTESNSGGPPTRGLFDSLETTQPTVLNNTSVVDQSASNLYPNHPKMLMNASNVSLFPDSPFNANTNEPNSLLQWVTVFGFPPSAINTVLSHISSRVRIVDKHMAPQPQSNWIHLKCASEQEAQRALACNGSIVSGSIMIGVIPCTDEGVLGSDKENRGKLSGNARPFGSIGKINQSPDRTSTLRTPIKIQNARPLAAGYSQHFSPQSVRSPENVPQKSTGLVSKAMEYVFGW